MLAAPDVPGGGVAHILVATHRGAPMAPLEDECALAHIEAFARELGVVLTPDMPRRNIVTAQVSLNDLCGKRFRVGDADRHRGSHSGR